MEHTEQALGSVIRARRIAQGMTLQSVSAEAGIDLSQLSKIERGMCSTSPSGYERIARALGWTAAAMWRAASNDNNRAA